MGHCRALLFDLDGTLADTAPDLAAALNHVLLQENHQTLPLTTIRQVASDGARGLLQLGFGIDEQHADFQRLRTDFLTYYATHIADHTTLFSGMEDILHRLETLSIPWGIVTNKPQQLTRALLEKLQLLSRASCVISGDSLPERKPHPAPLLHAAKLLSLPAEACCYVGDAERDIQAAKAARMVSIAALYGYLHPEATPTTWQADIYVHNIDALHKVIQHLF
jgi:N-acetyl-D-muramate 6-phosphate phosphatase